MQDSFFWQEFAKIPENCYVSNLDLRSLRCLFVYLNTVQDLSGNDYPISFGLQASILRMNGAEAKIIIQDIDNYNSEVYDRYDVVTFFPMATLLRRILYVASKVKNDYPNTKICLLNSEQHQHEMVLSTPDAIKFAQNILNEYPSVDIVLIGEAEAAFLKLCENLVKGLNDFDNVPACLYRQNGEIKTSKEPIQPVQFEYLPYPSRDLLETGISGEGINTFSPRIQSSRGCLSPCSYCVESSSNIITGGRKSPWLGRDIAKFLDEIEYLSREFKVAFFNVIDSSFEDSGGKGISRMESFCKEIVKRGIETSFKIHIKVNTINKLDDTFLGLLKEAGVDVLVIGVESGIDRELKSYRKITTPEKNVENVHRVDKYGKFFLLLGHMMFSPVLVLEDLYDKVNYLKEIGRCWDFLNMSNNVLVFRGTAYHNYLLQLGLTKDHDGLSGTIPYRYEDERVGLLAKEIGSLKMKCPAVITLNNLLYDAQNIIARYHNKMNKHLWVNEKAYVEFKDEIGRLLVELGGVYYNYFIKLVRLAEKRWSSEDAEEICKIYIHSFVPTALERAKTHISNFTDSFKKLELSTCKLYLKTWLSLINTQVNTSGGEVSNA